MNAERKNRLVFFLVWLHIFLGITNLITANLVLDRTLSAQLPTYAALLIYGIMSFFLLLKKNGVRIIFIALFFFSLPASLLTLRFNVLFTGNLFQLLLSIIMIGLLLQKDVKALYISDKSSTGAGRGNSKTEYAKGDLLSNVESIVGADSIYITDMECVDDASDYKDVIADILRLADITNVEVDACEGEQRTVNLRCAEGDHSFQVWGNSDYIDPFNLVKGLNEFLEKINKPGKVYSIWNCDWGQEGGFVYTTEVERMNRLIQMKNEYTDYGEISDGVNKNEPAEP